MVASVAVRADLCRTRHAPGAHAKAVAAPRVDLRQTRATNIARWKQRRTRIWTCGDLHALVVSAQRCRPVVTARPVEGLGPFLRCLHIDAGDARAEMHRDFVPK